jgi:hypothetical protein
MVSLNVIAKKVYQIITSISIYYFKDTGLSLLARIGKLSSRVDTIANENHSRKPNTL